MGPEGPYDERLWMISRSMYMPVHSSDINQEYDNLVFFYVDIT